MPKLLEKSKFNIDAARVLIDENLHAPSVHCSYYSCLQKIKSILPAFFGITYEQIDKEVSSGNLNEHSYLIRYISEQIHHNLGFIEYRDFKNKIGDLKEFRVESDYKNIEITSDQSEKAYRKATEINVFLLKQFHQ